MEHSSTPTLPTGAVARLLGTTASTVRKAARRGSLPSAWVTTPGGIQMRVFDPGDVASYRAASRERLAARLHRLENDAASE